MNYCQNCRKENDRNANFCRYCGSVLDSRQNPYYSDEPPTQIKYVEKVAPIQNEETQNQARPYMWKTDEFQVNQPKARETQNIYPIQPAFQPPPQKAQVPQPYIPPSYLTQGYRCPRCGSTATPYLKRQVSTAGWIVFSLLLVFTWVFFWIGLLIREDARICPVCNLRVA